jgi:PAS domain S-box-containing protein
MSAETGPDSKAIAGAPSARTARTRFPVLPALLFAVLAVGIVLFGLRTLRQYQGGRLVEESEELGAVAALKVEQIATWRAERLADAAGIAANPLVARAVGGAARGVSDARLQEDLLAWFETLRTHFDYDAVALLDDRGRLVVSSGATAGEIGSFAGVAPDAIGEALRSGREALSDIYRHGDGSLHLDLVAPLVLRDGAPRGVGAVLLRIDAARHLFPLLQAWPVPSPTAETLLVRRDGDQVVFLNELRHRKGTALTLRLPLDQDSLPGARAARGEEGFMEGTDYRGQAVLAVGRRVPGSPWALVAKIDAAEALAPLHAQERSLLLVMGSLLVASATGIAWWWRRQTGALFRRSAQAEAERTSLVRQLDYLARYLNDMVFLSDSDHRIIEANDRACAILGYSRQELLALGVRDLRDPATLGDFEARVEAQVANQKAEFETRYRRKDGTTFPVEASVRVLEIGGKRYFQGVARDITERKRAEEALRASEEKFRAAFFEAGIAAVIVDAGGRILDFNRLFRQMLGHPTDALRRMALRDVLHPGDAAREPALLAALLEGKGPPRDEERRFLRQDGEVVLGILRASAVRDASGAFLFGVATVEDVTQKRSMERQLLLADRMASMGTLAAGVAHEINNPLAFIVANLGFAVDELNRAAAPPDAVIQALAEAREGAARVRDIVRDLKTFSREDAGEGGVADVREVLRSSANLAQNEIRHRARMVMELRAAPRVAASERRLGQVFLNLLINAAQAIPEGQAQQNFVRAETRTDASGRAVVEIQDTGSGIPPELLGRIFDPFFTTKPVGVGTGLGLSICHGIVTSLGGEIQVDSAPGRGSTFRVLLPPAPGAEGAAEAAPGPALEGRRGRVLVVDDEPLVGRAVTRVLGPRHEVVAVTSARDALSRLEADSGFDVVLCDLMMPEMTGMDLHAELSRRAPALARRMVFLTGGAFTARAREFLDGVHNPRVEKPFDPEGLRGLVTSILGGGARA